MLSALTSHHVASLRDALRSAVFTVDAIGELIGPDAHRALMRNETTPARRAASDGGPLATLVRLFSLQTHVPIEAAELALPGLVDSLRIAGVLERSVGEVRARVDIRPYGDTGFNQAPGRDWFVVCDLTPGLDGGERRVASDWVLGISEASNSLAQLTIRDQIGSALDLGTGCGVQSLHLAGHAHRVVATDVNERALAMARLTSELNEASFEVRAGSLFDPVARERFDLVVTNPPFVVSPGTGERLVYRDSGLPGDEVVRRIVTQAPAHLNPGGWCQVLANWVHRDGEPWQERIAGWIKPGRCDAWVLQREVVDLATYVEMWLADAGLNGAPDYVQRYDTWLSWFADQGIEAIGFGWLALRNAGREQPVTRIEEWPYDIEQPLGPHVAAWGSRVDAASAHDGEALLDTHLVWAVDLVQETFGAPGAEDPARIVVRLQRGVRRARQVDTVEAGLVGACDGDLTVGQILDALATLLDRDAEELRRTYVPVVRELVDEGFLA